MNKINKCMAIFTKAGFAVTQQEGKLVFLKHPILGLITETEIKITDIGRIDFIEQAEELVKTLTKAIDCCKQAKEVLK